MTDAPRSAIVVVYCLTSCAILLIGGIAAVVGL